MAEGAGGAKFGKSVLYSAFGVVTTTVAGRASPNTTRSTSGRRSERRNSLRSADVRHRRRRRRRLACPALAVVERVSRGFSRCLRGRQALQFCGALQSRAELRRGLAGSSAAAYAAEAIPKVGKSLTRVSRSKSKAAGSTRVRRSIDFSRARRSPAGFRSLSATTGPTRRVSRRSSSATLALKTAGKPILCEEPIAATAADGQRDGSDRWQHR